MRVLVCGGRTFNNRELVYNTLYNIADEFNLRSPSDEYGNSLPLGLHIISGEASGADSIATDFAVVNLTGYSGYPADWEKYGKSAGPSRNTKMLVDGKPDMVIAFPGGRGTADMVRKAQSAGIPVREINGD
jgi:hypothetical protein